VSHSLVVFNLKDNGGRRSGIERRRFSYRDHIPERRRFEDRRSGLDRRSGKERRRLGTTGNFRVPRTEQRQSVMRERRSEAGRRSGETQVKSSTNKEFLRIA
jgi:hypothetical protein